MKQWSIGLMSNDEKRNILDQHKTLYNGFKTMQPKVSNEQPLYIQDFANDKGGVTVNNKGNVKAYTNVGINEQVEKESMCSECGGMMYEGECSECGYKGGEMGEEMQQVKDLKNVEDLNLSDKFDYTEEEMYEEEEITTDPNKETETQDPHQVGPSTDDGFGEYQDGDVYEDEEIGEQVGGGTAPYQNFDSIKPAYNFVSGGPVKEDEFETMESAWADDKDDMMIDMEDDDEVYPIFTKDEFLGMGKKLGDMELGDSKSSSWEEITPDSDEDDLSHLDEEIRESVTKQKNRIMEMMNRMKGYN